MQTAEAVSRLDRPAGFRRVFLANPPTGLYRRDERCQNKVEDQTVVLALPPLDLLYVAAVFERAGATAAVHDYPVEGGDSRDLVRHVREFAPDLVVLATTTPTVGSDMEAARLVREAAPEAAILAKGGYFWRFDGQGMADYPQVDGALRTEFEFAADDLARGLPLEAIAGLTYRDGGKVVRNPDRPPRGDIDSLPNPARHLIDNRRYRSPENGAPIATVMSSKGCPSRCIYCPSGFLSNFTIRFRSPESIAAEMEECVRRHGIDHFLFSADTFTWQKSWTIKLCQEILARGLKVRWGCNSKVNTIDDERLVWLKRAGCWVIGFGVESGDEEMLEKMKKGATLEQAREAIALCRKHGMKSHAFFVIGLPWETEATLARTLAFARDIDPDFFDFNIAFPLPGTEFYEIADASGLFESTLEAHGYGNASTRSFALSSADLMAWRRRMLLSMYLRPGYIARTIAWAASSPKTLGRLGWFGARRLWSLATAGSSGA